MFGGLLVSGRVLRHNSWCPSGAGLAEGKPPIGRPAPAGRSVRRMANGNAKKTIKKKPIESYDHKDKKRANNGRE